MRRVATFYRFTELDALELLADELRAAARRHGLRGTVLLAAEGVNATIVGDEPAIDALLAVLADRPGLSGIQPKYSQADAENDVFHRFKVKIKDEIVTFGVPSVNPARQTGEHVGPERWHELLDDPQVVVIDTRNRYETAIGTFTGAVDPDTENFRDFPAFVRASLDPEKQHKVAMFCTGGIRCEKASAYLLDAGFESVYQLEGGVLNYLESVPEAQSRWEGECFVFDQRVSVDGDLRQGQYEQCFACRRPLSADDLEHESYEAGVRCPHCAHERDDSARDGFRERRRQVVLASNRGEKHVGQRQTTISEAN